jgi:acetyl esterase/lipase
MKYLTALVAIAGSIVACWGCQKGRMLTAGDIPGLPSVPPSARIAYGPGPQHFAELRLPEAATAPLPVVVILHGGCWGEYADAGYMGSLASSLTSREGWATWNLEYRGVHQAGGGWPGTFLDVGLGIDALRGAAAEHPLDLTRVVAIGHSAGGHLALWAAARSGLPAGNPLFVEQPLPLRGIVSLAGIADLRAFYEYGQGPCGNRQERLMGGPPEAHPERYAVASPSERLPLGVPQVLLWGALDRVVPQELFEAYESAAREAGDRVESITVEGAAHHEFGAPRGRAYQAIVSGIRRLLDGAGG